MSKIPSASLRNIASKAKKSRPQPMFSTQVPVVKKGTFTGDDSVDSSSSSDSDSEVDIKKESSADFFKKISTPASKTQATGASANIPKTATPAKSPSINGISAPKGKSKNKTGVTVIKKEEAYSGSSDSESSSDEKTKKPSKNGKQIKKSDSASGTSSSSSSEASSSSESESESDHKAKRSKSPAKSPAKSPVKKDPKRSAIKAKSPVKKESSAEVSTSSSESESGSDSEEASEDTAEQIQKQISNDLKNVKSLKAQSPDKTSSKKAKRSKQSTEDDDGDVQMVDQTLALTNGMDPADVGIVPEFIAPDFHLRKLEGPADAADVADFFSKAQLEGKQVWYITAPASLPVTVVQDLSIPMDKAQQGLSVLNHNGDDYRLAFENPSASSSFRLLIPSKQGNEYTLLERSVDQTMHFTRSETFPPEGPSCVITTKTVSTSKPGRAQPEGLRARYTPLGVPAPAPVNKAIASVAAAESAPASTPSKSSSKKKRKHSDYDDGENGSVATTAITTPVFPAPTKASSKITPAEKSAKKQKTSKEATARKETPVPLPPQFSSMAASAPRYPASQPAPRSWVSSSPMRATYLPADHPMSLTRHLIESRSRSRSLSKSPGPALPATQLPPPSTKYSLVPHPTFPPPSSYAYKGPSSFSSPAAAAKEREKKAKKERKRAEKEQAKEAEKAAKDSEKLAKEAEKERKKIEKEQKAAEKERKKATPKTPRNVSHIMPPQFDSRGRPLH